MSHIALYQNQHEQFVIVYSTLGEEQIKRSVQSEYIYNTSSYVTDPISQDNQVHDTLTCTYCSIHCRLCLRRRVITKNISNSCLLLINDKQNKLTVQPPNFLPAPTLSPPAQTNSFAFLFLLGKGGETLLEKKYDFWTLSLSKQCNFSLPPWERRRNLIGEKVWVVLPVSLGRGGGCSVWNARGGRVLLVGTNNKRGEGQGRGGRPVGLAG